MGTGGYYSIIWEDGHSGGTFIQHVHAAINIDRCVYFGAVRCDDGNWRCARSGKFTTAMFYIGEVLSEQEVAEFAVRSDRYLNGARIQDIGEYPVYAGGKCIGENLNDRNCGIEFDVMQMTLRHLHQKYGRVSPIES